MCILSAGVGKETGSPWTDYEGISRQVSKKATIKLDTNFKYLVRNPFPWVHNVDMEKY